MLPKNTQVEWFALSVFAVGYFDFGNTTLIDSVHIGEILKLDSADRFPTRQADTQVHPPSLGFGETSS
jgi:hypothetical protein